MIFRIKLAIDILSRPREMLSDENNSLYPDKQLHKPPIAAY